MQPRWKDGSKSMVTVNAIFAGFTGVLIAHYAFDDRHQYVSEGAHTACIVASAFAFWLFAWAAERITDALDEGKVQSYLWSMVIYNLGVVLALVSVTLYLTAVYGWSYSWLFSVALSIYPWLWHVVWILYNSVFDPKVIDRYVAELSASADV